MHRKTIGEKGVVNAVGEWMRKKGVRILEEQGRKEPERAAPAMAAASGLFAAAAAAVDRGIDLDESAEGKGDAAVKTREKKKRNSSVLLAARAASARVEDMGVAAYSRELQGKASNKEFPFSY